MGEDPVTVGQVRAGDVWVFSDKGSYEESDLRLCLSSEASRVVTADERRRVALRSLLLSGEGIVTTTAPADVKICLLARGSS